MQVNPKLISIKFSEKERNAIRKFLLMQKHMTALALDPDTHDAFVGAFNKAKARGDQDIPVMLKNEDDVRGVLARSHQRLHEIDGFLDYLLECVED